MTSNAAVGLRVLCAFCLVAPGLVLVTAGLGSQHGPSHVPPGSAQAATTVDHFVAATSLGPFTGSD